MTWYSTYCVYTFDKLDGLVDCQSGHWSAFTDVRTLVPSPTDHKMSNRIVSACEGSLAIVYASAQSHPRSIPSQTPRARTHSWRVMRLYRLSRSRSAFVTLFASDRRSMSLTVTASFSAARRFRRTRGPVANRKLTPSSSQNKGPEGATLRPEW
jgi:hypothetical protein